MMRHALITGGAGFLGSHLADLLLDEGDWTVTLVDNFDPFYPEAIKRRNVAAATGRGARLREVDVADAGALDGLEPADVIVHLAAKAGVRPSFDDPVAYYRANVVGTDAVIRHAVASGCQQVVLVSSSSVYGMNPRTPWREDDHELLPISPYAASKIASEQIARAYAARYDLRVPALRLFTVYGPRQRPDLAIHTFARRLLHGEPITLFGDGSTFRDYTFVDDIIAGIRSAMQAHVQGVVPINLAGGRRITLIELVRALEAALGVQARIEWAPEQPGDVPATHASIDLARAELGYEPTTTLARGLDLFAAWFRDQPEAVRPR